MGVNIGPESLEGKSPKPLSTRQHRQDLLLPGGEVELVTHVPIKGLCQFRDLYVPPSWSP